jgi:hypothetical protein
MALSAGTRLGPYEIQAAIGAGGMGEVHRARDTKLNRDVALKVLFDVFTADPERLARFKREAQVLASLNHPNIGAIYGLEDSDGVQALVLELVEGPTLAAAHPGTTGQHRGRVLLAGSTRRRLSRTDRCGLVRGLWGPLRLGLIFDTPDRDHINARFSRPRDALARASTTPEKRVAHIPESWSSDGRHLSFR